MTKSHLTLNDIKPYGKNAKKHPDDQLERLAKCVAEVGWRIPALVNQEGTLIAGHGRWMSYLRFHNELNLKPIWIIDDTGKTVSGEACPTAMTKEQEEMYRIADNSLNESEWDKQILLGILKEMSLPMLQITGMQRLVIKNTDRDDVVPPVPVNAKSKVGDLYELGPHRILCGDSTKGEAYAQLLGAVKADMVFTDPPYNVDYHGGGKNTSMGIMNDKMGGAQFREFLIGAFRGMGDVVKKGAALYVFHSPKTQSIFEDALNTTGFEIKYQLIWNKPHAGMGMGDYRAKHEPFFYACVKGTAPLFYGDRANTSIIDFQKTDAQLAAWAKKEREMQKQGKMTVWTMKREPTMDYVHPTQKPVELVMYALANSSKVEDVVLDPFLGSGSTLIACQKTNRVCSGMELDPKYVDVIVTRWVEYTENRAIKKNGEKLLW
jgi:DNA modification methylase